MYHYFFNKTRKREKVKYAHLSGQQSIGFT